jgi:hypothetical protein
MKQQVETVASSQECVEEHTKNAREKGRQNKSPYCVLWADKTQDVSCEQTRQGLVLCLVNTSTGGIQNTGPHGQTTFAHVDKKICSRYARSKMRGTK